MLHVVVVVVKLYRARRTHNTRRSVRVTQKPCRKPGVCTRDAYTRTRPAAMPRSRVCVCVCGFVAEQRRVLAVCVRDARAVKMFVSQHVYQNVKVLTLCVLCMCIVLGLARVFVFVHTGGKSMPQSDTHIFRRHSHPCGVVCEMEYLCGVFGELDECAPELNHCGTRSEYYIGTFV